MQPGSLESEAGIFAMTFDQTGSRLICAEADKTIKLYKEDEQATPETHPVSFRPPKDIRRFWVVPSICTGYLNWSRSNKQDVAHVCENSTSNFTLTLLLLQIFDLFVWYGLC